MKKDTKITISVIAAIVFGIIADIVSTGDKGIAHYLGVLMFSTIFFFVIMTLLEKIINSKYFNQVQYQNELKRKLEEELKSYQETKNSFKYFSDNRLLSLYKQFQQDGDENLERLALEEELVERRLIENSQMHEKLYLMKRRYSE